MIRRLPSVYLVLALALAAFSALNFALQSRGYVSASNLDLWGRALLANGGASRFEDVVSAYPPLAYISTICVDALFPALGMAAPKLLGTLFGALLVAAWFDGLRRKQIGQLGALLGTAALGGNPLFLRALAEGPGFVLLHWGLWLAALGVFGLRGGQRVNDIILISLGMALMAFAHPFGAVLVFALLPFLALVIPADRLRDAPATMFLVLVFPVAISVLSFCYVNWVFAGEPLSFVGRISRESAGLGPYGTAVNQWGWALAPLSMFAVCPIAIAMFLRSKGMAPLRFAVQVLLASLIAASILASLFDILPPFALVASLAVTVAAACAAKWPVDHTRWFEIVLLLIGGFAGGILVSFADRAPETLRWRAALAGQSVAPVDPELATLGAFLADREAILFDADRAPIVIAERRSAHGIWSAGSDEFRLAALRGQSEADTIVVQNRDLEFGADRVGQIFPEVYDDRLAGFKQVYDGTRWRVFSRQTEPRT